MGESLRIEEFLKCSWFAVAGASSNRGKYGNKVLRSYLQAGLQAVPINPRAEEIEGQICFASLTAAIAAFPGATPGLSVVTPPKITELVIEEAVTQGVQHIWLQPGAESGNAVKIAEDAGLQLISGGPCVLVQLRFRND
ncbi:MAG: CoA-binding protein [Planctomycetota bacterium]|nr:CoA-binding protein [Planctomycetota bacterium]